MSEKPRRKRKDETWTKEELTTALHRNGDKHRKEKSRSSEDQLSRELRKEKHSSHRNLDDERKSRRKIEEKERRHKERREAHDDANPRGVKREKEKPSRHELHD
uniref:Uncharacterized protein n=1 Tax=Ciona savignyi TaxID=51511 RepID=H2Y916_CIOSA